MTTPIIPNVITNNQFKSTAIYGNFKNLSHPDASILADGYFQRNLTVDGSTSISGNLTVSGTLTAYGNHNVTGTLNVNNVTLNEYDASGILIINTSGIAMKSHLITQINDIINAPELNVGGDLYTAGSLETHGLAATTLYLYTDARIDGTTTLSGILNINALTLNEYDASGILTGVNISGIAMKDYVTTQINNLIGGQPSTFYDTLKEISDYIQSDANLSTTLTNSIGAKANTLDVASTYATINTCLINPNTGIQFDTASNEVVGIYRNTGTNRMTFYNDTLTPAYDYYLNGVSKLVIESTKISTPVTFQCYDLSCNTLLVGTNVNFSNGFSATTGAFTGLVTYNSLPTCTSVPNVATQLVNKFFVDNALGSYSTTTVMNTA
jgi:hypothetical protein